MHKRTTLAALGMGKLPVRGRCCKIRTVADMLINGYIAPAQSPSTMVTKEEKKKILHAILVSPDFKDSKRYQDLLKYLVEETLAGNSPKEITIGMQFFGKDASFDPKDDPTVRVYLNNLRKKLEHHYLTTDQSAPFRLEIPKGHYQVEFVKSPEKPPPTRTSPVNWRWLAGGGTAAGLILGILIARIAFPSSDFPAVAKPGLIWNEYLVDGGRPTLILLGDFFYLYERPDTGKAGRFIRDLNINSVDDFRQVVRRDPSFARKYVQADFTFLRPSASWGLASILPILQSSPKGYTLKLASQFAIEDLKTNNVVFIGSFKSLFNLKKILHLFHIDYNLSPASFRLTGLDSSGVFSAGNIGGGNYEQDHAVIAKAYGPEGSTIILLLGFSDTGVIESAKAITDPEIMRKISEKLPQIREDGPFAFTAVLKTEGINQSIFKYEIRQIVETAPSMMRPEADSSQTR